ncbi:uncharacterized protein UHOD_01591 [Ustilago sp. UG-2017b]|nr:uncharacterized protein UHOD_01591 [Ustilago sp. UG-2017b]
MHASNSAEHERTYDANSAATQSPGITDELFRRFMNYERAKLSKGSSPTATFADLDIPATMMNSRSSYSSSRGDEPNHVQFSIRRPIRGMPRRSFHASLPAAVAKAAPPALTQSTVNHEAASPDPAGQFGPSASNIAASGVADTIPQNLSQDFQRLSVSPQRVPPSTQEPVAAAQTTVDSSSHPNSDAHFQFPTLPPKLTDDGFHYRQRAAQFILLCSREATPDRLTKLNRLSLPLVPRSSNASQGRRGAGARKLDDIDRSTMHDDDESIHSHHDPHNASDDDSEHLDFDACRTAHLGNKKKRKSSRFSGQGLTTTTVVRSLPEDGDTSHGNKIVDRALADRTNTASQSTVDREDQRNGDLLAYAKLELATFRYPESARLPPRQSRGEYQMQRLRQRVRTRVASVLLQRRYAQMEAERKARQEEEARREAQLAQSKVEADSQQAASPEKKPPPKRAMKAGKRAQAIRGGNSASKPLTIAEIRARAAAAAAAAGGGAQNGSRESKTKGSPSPPRRGSDTADVVKQETRNDAPEPEQTTTRRDSTPRSTVSPVPGTISRQQSPQPNGHATQPSQSQQDATPTTTEPKVTLPTSTFDFRMSSAVTLRLRELRSQLDAATRNLSDTAKAGDTHAVAQALSETVAAPPAAPVRPFDPNLPWGPDNIPPTPSRGPSWDLPDNAPPWVRPLLDYQYHLEQQEKQAAGGSRPSGKTAGQLPLPPPPVVSHARSGSSTPGRALHTASLVPPPSSTKVQPATRTKAKTSNGRCPATRKSTPHTDSTHKNGSGCKHGHPHTHSSGLGSALFTPDDWICLFCEYELYYGEPPLMFRACRNRKKLVEKKSKAKSKAQAALSKKGSTKVNGAGGSGGVGEGGCGHHHHHNDHDDHHHEDESCCHDHGSVTSDDRHHHHHAHHHGGNGEGGERERCDCGNSIHSSDFDDH